MDEISKNILAVLIWFDMFDWPLEEGEINFFQKKSSPRQEIKKKLSQLLSSGVIQQKEGFYFLKNRKKIVFSRKKSQQIADKKIKKAIRATKFISKIPFVRAVFVCNFLSMGLAKKEDDIDFFIITEKQKIWTTRFLVTGFFKILNKRPDLKKNKIADKFCFSFYISESNLDLQQIKLPDDPYLENWILGLEPIFIESDHILEKFVNDNKWILAGKDSFKQKNKYLIKNKKNKGIKKIIRFGLSLFSEKVLKKIQLFIMPTSLKGKPEADSGVLISDQILKFHLKDGRQYYADLYQKKLEKHYGFLENK